MTDVLTSPDLDRTLSEVRDRVLWLSTAIVDAANRRRPKGEHLKVGGHQASSASMVDIMVAWWFHELTVLDRVSVKPHASPVLHAINYLLGDLDRRFLSELRAKDGLQSYPSRLKDPDTVDFSTGSVGIGATAPLWAAISHRYLKARFTEVPPAGRFISLVGDAELDEGAIWEAIGDPNVSKLGELVWVVVLNRQSLDRVVPGIQSGRWRAMFEAAGWEVVTLKWGRGISQFFGQRGGEELRARLESMPNEEYQRLLRAPQEELSQRLQGRRASSSMSQLVESIPPNRLAELVRDLGGHDMRLLIDTFASLSDSRPSVVFAYTIKGRGLPTEGHPNNHSALLTEEQMTALATACGVDIADPWAPFPEGHPARALCVRRGTLLTRRSYQESPTIRVPTALGHPHRKPTSTQAAFGRLLSDLKNDVPELATRIVTCSPDVASSTNLGGWINKTGIWSVSDRRDWFADDAERLLRWVESNKGQHLELGIAEVNLVGLLGELGATWSRWGERLIPIATLYDPFVLRALEPWSYGMYAGGQSILVGTPSGVTLAPEGGAHQSITTPSIGLEQPACVAWEPAFAQDLEWCFLHAMDNVGVPGGMSAYFRLSTRTVDPEIATPPNHPVLVERRRRHAVAGGYRITQHHSAKEEVTLVGVGAMMPEVVKASRVLEAEGVVAGVVCLTSPDLVFRSFQGRGRTTATSATDIAEILFPKASPTPIVTVMDGHPHTLAFLAALRGDAIRCLGVTEFGQSSDLQDAHMLHQLDVDAIVDAAMTLVHR